MLSQCIGIVQELSRYNQFASFSVRIGGDFDFSYSNQDLLLRRKLSPSQQNRNRIRRINYQQSKSSVSKCDNRQFESNMKQESMDNFTQTDTAVNTDAPTCKNERETQTDATTFKDVEVSTDEEEILKLDSVLDIKENGVIEARNNTEKVIEVRMSHNFKTWEEIRLYIKETLSMTLIGRPWLANTGNHFKTVGFRTKVEDYEAWKIRTFNWQESSIRAVSSSRLYR